VCEWSVLLFEFLAFAGYVPVAEAALLATRARETADPGDRRTTEESVSPYPRLAGQLHCLGHKYGVFQPTGASYPQHVVDKGAGTVDKWNRCNKDLTLRNHMFTNRHK
jgi:hypothetical protein